VLEYAKREESAVAYKKQRFQLPLVGKFGFQRIEHSKRVFTGTQEALGSS
jgi:hypothetical protein